MISVALLLFPGLGLALLGCKIVAELNSSRPRALIIMSRPTQVRPASISLVHLFLGRPLLSTPLHTPTSSAISDRPPSSRARRTTSPVLCCYDRLIGSDSNFVAM